MPWRDCVRKHSKGPHTPRGWRPASIALTSMCFPAILMVALETSPAQAKSVDSPVVVAGDREAVDSEGIVPANTVSAALVQSFHGCAVIDAWQELNANWSSYGTVPVSITTNEALCSDTFTLGDLEASGADTLILSASASRYQLTQKEINAIQAYVNEGHTILGTSLTFGGGQNDNNGLSATFGFAEQSVWRKSGDSGSPFTYKLRQHNPAAKILLRSVPNPYVSTNVDRCQKPADSHWSGNELGGATLLGRNADATSAITVYSTGSYNAVFIANTPEYQSTNDDLQFLYNAVIYPRNGVGSNA